MGLSGKPVSGDAIDWGRTLSGAAELPKPPSSRRQPPPHQQSEAVKCPRCSSTNTKFCYYNNYNKSQPRHFCKSCKRHWTKGGTLRNVPVGGGRKNKRPKVSKPAAATSAAAAQRRQDLPDFSSTDGQKSMSNFFYQALIRSSSPLLHDASKINFPAKSFAGNNDVDTEFQFSNLNNFDMNASLNPYQSLDAFDHYAVNLDSVEESTITTVNMPGSSSGPWPGPDISGNLELPNCWNWNDIDVLTSADLNIPWDGDGDINADTKP